MTPRAIRKLISYLKGANRLEGYADSEQTGLRFVINSESGRTRIMRPGTAQAYATHLLERELGVAQ